ncbi:MAG: 50S ribosomal protein L21 [Clostridiales bacterium]|nr:50S ribosomal protein L21 [Clostridiales bacterium]
MYAIIETGGKQYKVEKDMLIKVEKLSANIGDSVELKALMLVNDNGEVITGAAASKAVVKAEVTRQDKSKKIIVFKYKPKKNSRKRQGHRQPFTELKIVSIG